MSSSERVRAAGYRVRAAQFTFHAGPDENANPREALTGWGASDASWSAKNEARTRIAFLLKMVSKYFKKQGQERDGDNSAA